MGGRRVGLRVPGFMMAHAAPAIKNDASSRSPRRLGRVEKGWEREADAAERELEEIASCNGWEWGHSVNLRTGVNFGGLIELCTAKNGGSSRIATKACGAFTRQ